MNYLNILIERVEIMFVLIILGFLLSKDNKLHSDFLINLGDFLLKVITPLTIFNSFLVEYSPEKLRQVILAFIFSFIVCLANLLISKIVYPKEENIIEAFSISQSNAGFFGMPVVMAVCGDAAAIYCAPFIAVNTLFMWTYWLYRFTNDRSSIQLKNMYKINNLVALILGLLFFVLRIPVPAVVSEAISSLGKCSNPCCSIIVGANLANTKLKDMKNDVNHIPSFICKLILSPILMTLIMLPISNDNYILKLSMVLMSSVPCAASTTIFAAKYGLNAEKGARLTCVCTLLSIVTMPLMSGLAMRIWG